jgi:hypothetical protein
MHQKILIGTFMVILCVLFVVCPGCTSLQQKTPVPAIQTPPITETQTGIVTPSTTPSTELEVTAIETIPAHDDLSGHDGSSAQDIAFNVFFVKSQAEIVNKTNSLLEAMVPGSMTVQAVYSPSMVYVRAEDLGFTAEKYYDQLLKMKTSSPENETKRIVYLQFLYSVKSSAYHIADAAQAESFGDYENALSMATAAKFDLQNIEVNPDLPPTIPINLLDVFLNEYIGRMLDKVTAMKESRSLLGH